MTEYNLYISVHYSYDFSFTVISYILFDKETLTVQKLSALYTNVICIEDAYRLSILCFFDHIVPSIRDFTCTSLEMYIDLFNMQRILDGIMIPTYSRIVYMDKSNPMFLLDESILYYILSKIYRYNIDFMNDPCSPKIHDITGMPMKHFLHAYVDINQLVQLKNFSTHEHYFVTQSIF